MTWGRPNTAQAALRGVDKIYSTEGAFAAVVEDGTVVTWGVQDKGGSPHRLQAVLGVVGKIYSAKYAFAAV